MKMLIFDMDGVILDSEPLHQRARELVCEKYGIEVNEEDLPNPVGKSSSEFYSIIFEITGTKGLNPDKLEAEQFELVGRLARENNVPCNDGLIELLSWCQDNDILIGLASSSNRHLVDDILDALGIADYFSYTVSGEEIASKKPAPDVYNKVLSLAGVSAADACAVEDSAAGIAAAKAAGIYCFGYNNPTSKGQNQSEADCIIDNLIQVISK